MNDLRFKVLAGAEVSTGSDSDRVTIGSLDSCNPGNPVAIAPGTDSSADVAQVY